MEKTQKNIEITFYTKKAENDNKITRNTDKTHKNAEKRKKRLKKRRKKWKNVETHRKTKKCVKKYPSDGTMGVPWARFGHSRTLLGRSWRLLGRPGDALGVLLGLLEASWTPLGRVLQKSLGATYLLEPNLGPKIHRSWIQNP